MGSKWQGWSAAAGLLMITVGGFRLFSGIIGLFNQEWVVRGFNAYYFVDLGALAWWALIVGAVLVIAGLGILAGMGWAKWLGVVFIVIGIISELAWIPVYPIWSIVIVALYALMLYGLIVAKPLDE